MSELAELDRLWRDGEEYDAIEVILKRRVREKVRERIRLGLLERRELPPKTPVLPSRRYRRITEDQVAKLKYALEADPTLTDNDLSWRFGIPGQAIRQHTRKWRVKK